MTKTERLEADKTAVLAAVAAAGSIDGMVIADAAGLSWGRAHRALAVLASEGAIERTATPMFDGMYLHVVYTAGTSTTGPPLAAVVPASVWPQLAAAAALLLLAVAAVTLAAYLAQSTGFIPGLNTPTPAPTSLTTFTK